MKIQQRYKSPKPDWIPSPIQTNRSHQENNENINIIIIIVCILSWFSSNIHLMEEFMIPSESQQFVLIQNSIHFIFWFIFCHHCGKRRKHDFSFYCTTILNSREFYFHFTHSMYIMWIVLISSRLLNVYYVEYVDEMRMMLI